MYTLSANRHSNLSAYYGFMILACYLYSQPLLAFRCGNWSVRHGDSTEDIYDACGEPLFSNSYQTVRETYSENYLTPPYRGLSYLAPGYSFPARQIRKETMDVFVEEWEYHFRRGGIPKKTIFKFENDRLVSLEHISRRGRSRGFSSILR